MIRGVPCCPGSPFDLPVVWSSAQPIQLADFALCLFERALVALADDPTFAERLAAAHLRLLLCTTVYSTVRHYKPMLRSTILVRHVSQLIETRQIVLARDRMFLHHFRGWLRAWPTDEQQRLREAYATERAGM